jgi:hypothetical protein
MGLGPDSLIAMLNQNKHCYPLSPIWVREPIERIPIAHVSLHCYVTCTMFEDRRFVWRD